MNQTRRDPAAWRSMLGYVRPHRWALLAGGVLSLATTATGLALPLAARRLVETLADHGAIAPVLLVMTLLVLANAAIGATGSYILRRTAESVVLAARRRLVFRLVRLRIPALDHREPGDLMSRVASDTTLLRDVTTGALVGAVTGTLALVATLIVMGLLDPVLLAVTVGVLGMAATVIGLVVPRINRAARGVQESVGLIGAALERMLGAMRTIKASCAETQEEQRIDAAATAAWRDSVRAAKWSAIAGNTGGLASQIAFLTVLAVGGAQVAAGAIAVGTLVAFLLYIMYLMPAINQVTDAVTDYQVGAAAIARIQVVETLPVEPTGRPGPLRPLGARPASVSFEDVRFRYDPELPYVHHGVCFAVPAGGMTALVGPSGAGKTTVFSLIERFYEPGSGHVRVDGRDVRDWPLPELRAAIGYVEQDAPVLSGSLRDNLLLAAPDSSPDAVDAVVATTRLDNLLTRLPDGLDTLVGHRGVRLSGGERQRVAIARALLRQPRLLLLDEVTSQLDAVNEAALRDAIAEAARITTVLMVAHRLSTVATADRIIVMDAGLVQAIGTHAELVATDPLYAELAATQFLATADTS
jgi:ATP-binding cassette subfamily C protein